MKTAFVESKFFREMFLRCKQAGIWVIAVSMVTNILMLTQPIYMLQVFGRVLTSHSIETLIYLTLIVIFVLFVMHALMWIRTRVLMQIADWLGQHLSRKSLTRCPDQILNGIGYGTQAMNDIGVVTSFLTSPAMFAILDVPWAPIFLLTIFLIHPYLGLLALIGALTLLAFAYLNEKITHQPAQEASNQRMRGRIFLDSAFGNSETVLAMGMMDSVLSHWEEYEETAKKILAPSILYGSLIQAATQFFRISLQVGILGLGAYLVLQGSITPGGMIACSILLGRTLAPVENAIRSWQMLLQSQAAYGRLSIHLSGKEHERESFLGETPKGSVEVKELHYRPNGQEKFILEQVHFKVNPGEVLAIIGPSGAGKTTLARLMMGVYPPTVGSVRLDGVETYTWSRNEFGNFVGYLPQNIELFGGTVADNIARMGTVDKNAVIAAAKEAGIHDYILRMPEGYQSKMGSFGTSVSGGIRQRIALARAVYQNPPLLILDEPNSNLDEEGIRALIQAIGRMRAEGKTVIIITHERSLLQYSTSVLYLHQGRICMYGPTQEVFKKMQEQTQSQGGANA